MNEQNNNGRFFNNIPNDPNMNNGNNFDTNTGQPINNMNSVPMGAPMEQEPALVNGFASQPMNNVPTMVPNPQQQPTAMPMNFDPNTGQPLPAGSGAMFDPNTGMPITPGFVSNNNTKKSNKKVFAIIGCLVALIGIFCLLFVRVISCESEQEQYGVTMTTKITALSVFGDIKTMEFKMEVDLSELDEDDREYMIKLIEGSYGGDEDTKIDVKKDKIIIEMEGFKKEEAGELDKDDLEDMFSSIDLTCK